jgi:hypothetical protein
MTTTMWVPAAARRRPPQLGRDQTLSRQEDRQTQGAPFLEHRQEQLQKGQGGACETSFTVKQQEIDGNNLDGRLRYPYEAVHTLVGPLPVVGGGGQPGRSN